MLELANRLLERGAQVAFCAVLNSYPHQRYWPRMSWIEFVVRRVVFHAQILTKLLLRIAIPYVAECAPRFVTAEQTLCLLELAADEPDPANR